MTAAEVGAREAGLVQSLAVQPHLVGCAVHVLPEDEREVQVVAEIDQTVESESEFVVIQELDRG